MRRHIEKECKHHGITSHTVLKNGRVKCKKCQQEYQRKHYQSNKQYYINKSKDRQKFLIDFTRRHKSYSGCIICGEKRWWVLDYHHNDIEDKFFGIGTSFRCGYGIKKLKKELRKCIVLCSNCHRDLHYRENYKQYK